MNEDNLYTILGLERGATIDEIKKAYKHMCLKYHPDKNKSNNTSDLFNKIKVAYDILSNNISKQKYDSLNNLQHKNLINIIFNFIKTILNSNNINIIINAFCDNDIILINELNNISIPNYQELKNKIEDRLNNKFNLDYINKLINKDNDLSIFYAPDEEIFEKKYQMFSSIKNNNTITTNDTTVSSVTNELILMTMQSNKHDFPDCLDNTSISASCRYSSGDGSMKYSFISDAVRDTRGTFLSLAPTRGGSCTSLDLEPVSKLTGCTTNKSTICNCIFSSKKKCSCIYSKSNEMNIFGKIKTSLEEIYLGAIKEITVKRQIIENNKIKFKFYKFNVPIINDIVIFEKQGNQYIDNQNNIKEGNLIVNIKYNKHKYFKRVNDYDIYVILPITLYELFNGFNKKFDYFDNQNITLFMNKGFKKIESNKLIINSTDFDGTKIIITLDNLGLIKYTNDYENKINERGKLIIYLILLKKNNFNSILKKYFN
jgi:hypothetical protein